MCDMQVNKIPFLKGETGFFYYHQWVPDEPQAWLHIMHGMSEHSARYNEFAKFLCKKGILVTAGDHRGHGKTGEAMSSNFHLADCDGWNKMVDDQLQFITHIKQTYDLPLMLMGHSMGSFLAIHFCQKFGQHLTESLNHKLSGLILSGSNYDVPKTWKAALYIANFERWRVGSRNSSSLLEKMSFGAFNNAFKPARTKSDWLSRDASMVDRYIEDPHCGDPLTTQSWCDFLEGMAELCDSRWLAKINKDLPIYLFSGQLDPVSKNGKGVEKLKQALLKSGIQNIDMLLYPEARHETLNEINRNEVYSDVFNWIKSRIPESSPPIFKDLE